MLFRVTMSINIKTSAPPPPPTTTTKQKKENQNYKNKIFHSVFIHHGEVITVVAVVVVIVVFITPSLNGLRLHYICTRTSSCHKAVVLMVFVISCFCLEHTHTTEFLIFIII